MQTVSPWRLDVRTVTYIVEHDAVEVEEDEMKGGWI
jgi:hypothetical protein